MPKGYPEPRVPVICRQCDREFLAKRSEIMRGNALVCSRRCRDDSKRKTFSADDFWSKVVKIENGCWTWNGLHDSNGYGLVNVDGVKTRCHRVAFTLTNGPVEKGKYVCHRCDNPGCCRPDHLFAGTALDNSRDCAEKGRNCRGEKNWAARLKEDDIRQIRRLYGGGGYLQREVGVLFGISQMHVYKIVHHKIWKHILD